MVVCQTVVIPRSEPAVEAVELFEDLRAHAKSFQSPEGEMFFSCPLHDCLGMFGLLWFVGDVDTKEPETIDPLHYSPVDVNGSLFGPSFPVVHNQLFCLAHIEREVVVLAPHCQFSDLLPIGHLIVVGDHHCCVVSKLNDGVGVVFGHVVGEQGGNTGGD